MNNMISVRRESHIHDAKYRSVSAIIPIPYSQTRLRSLAMSMRAVLALYSLNCYSQKISLLLYEGVIDLEFIGKSPA